MQILDRSETQSGYGETCRYGYPNPTADRKKVADRLYFRDNLEWLRDRREFPNANVDLVYLDPAT